MGAQRYVPQMSCKYASAPTCARSLCARTLCVQESYSVPFRVPIKSDYKWLPSVGGRWPVLSCHWINDKQMLSFLNLIIIQPPPVFFVPRDPTMKLTWLPMIFLANTKLSPTAFASLHMFFLCHCCCIYHHSSLKTSFCFFFFFLEDSLTHTRTYTHTDAHTHSKTDWLIWEPLVQKRGKRRKFIVGLLRPRCSMGGSIYGCNHMWQPPEVKHICKTLRGVVLLKEMLHIGHRHGAPTTSCYTLSAEKLLLLRWDVFTSCAFLSKELWIERADENMGSENPGPWTL